MNPNVHRPPTTSRAPWLEPSALWAEVLHQTSRSITIDVGMPEQSRVALKVLCASLNAIGPRLHFFGKQRIRQRLLEALTMRVRLMQSFADHHEMGAIAVPRPIVIVAPFRSGTTYLHRLLSEDRRFRWVRPWESTYAPRGSSASLKGEAYLQQDERIELLRRDLANLYRRQPLLEQLHPVAVNEAEECFGFLESSMLSSSFMFYAPLCEYMAWLEDVNEKAWDSAYGHYRNHLRHLAWHLPGEHWLLKCPVHLWNLGAFRRICPDSLFVHVHRDPVKTVLSLCTLLRAHHELSLHDTNPREIGQLAMRFYQFALARAVNERRRAPAGGDVDLSLDELNRKPIPQIRRIFAAAGLVPDVKAEARMQKRASDYQHSAVRAGHDSLDSYGLQEGEIRELFSGYQSFADAAV